MRFPKDSLDDFKHFGARKPVPPPRWKSIGPTGEVEIVKPLKTSYVFSKHKASRHSLPLLAGLQRLSWFHRSLALSGAFATIVLILGTAIFIGIYGPPAGSVAVSSEVAINEEPSDNQTPFIEETEPNASDLLSDSNAPSMFAAPSLLKSVKRSWIPRRTKPRVLFAAYRPRQFVPRPQFVVSSFVPTTLVIYIENGEIKTRIEPWITASYKSRKASE